MNKNHRHYKLAKAWLAGAQIQVEYATGWHNIKNPRWKESLNYRIKGHSATPTSRKTQVIRQISNLLHQL
jgi:hypothetical protein